MIDINENGNVWSKICGSQFCERWSISERKREIDWERRGTPLTKKYNTNIFLSLGDVIRANNETSDTPGMERSTMGYRGRKRGKKRRWAVVAAEYACTRCWGLECVRHAYSVRACVRACIRACVRALYKHHTTVQPPRFGAAAAKPNDWARVRARVARIGCWIIYEWSVRAVA